MSVEFTAEAEQLRAALGSQLRRIEHVGPTAVPGLVTMPVVDIALIFEQLAAIRIADAARTRDLRQRYLTLIFDGLRAHQAKPLPGPAPTWTEVNGRWDV